MTNPKVRTIRIPGELYDELKAVADERVLGTNLAATHLLRNALEALLPIDEALTRPIPPTIAAELSRGHHAEPIELPTFLEAGPRCATTYGGLRCVLPAGHPPLADEEHTVDLANPHAIGVDGHALEPITELPRCHHLDAGDRCQAWAGHPTIGQHEAIGRWHAGHDLEVRAQTPADFGRCDWVDPGGRGRCTLDHGHPPAPLEEAPLERTVFDLDAYIAGHRPEYRTAAANPDLDGEIPRHRPDVLG